MPLEAGLTHQRDAIYQAIQIKSTGIPSEALDHTHLREAFANKASNKINLNHENVILLYAILHFMLSTQNYSVMVDVLIHSTYE